MVHSQGPGGFSFGAEVDLQKSGDMHPRGWCGVFGGFPPSLLSCMSRVVLGTNTGKFELPFHVQMERWTLDRTSPFLFAPLFQAFKFFESL